MWGEKDTREVFVELEGKAWSHWRNFRFTGTTLTSFICQQTTKPADKHWQKSQVVLTNSFFSVLKWKANPALECFSWNLRKLNGSELSVGLLNLNCAQVSSLEICRSWSVLISAVSIDELFPENCHWWESQTRQTQTRAFQQKLLKETSSFPQHKALHWSMKPKLVHITELFLSVKVKQNFDFSRQKPQHWSSKKNFRLQPANPSAFLFFWHFIERANSFCLVERAAELWGNKLSPLLALLRYREDDAMQIIILIYI